MSTSKNIELNRAQVTLTPPGGVRITLLNGGGLTDLTGPMHRQSLYQVFYEMYRRHPWVRAAIDKRASTAVSAGYQMTPEDPTKDINESEAREFRAFARRSNFAQLRRQWYKDIDIFSEGWSWVQHTKGNKPWKAHRLHPKFVFPKINEKGTVTGIDYGTGEKKRHFPIDQLLHFRDEDPDQDIAGLSKLYSLMETVSQDLYTMRYNLAFFENSAQTGIVFNMRNASKEEADRNRTWLEQNYTGADRAHRPIVLEGDIDIKASVAKHSDMQFIEGRRVHRQEILAVLDVNETLLGVTENANRSNSKENDLSFRDAIASRQLLVEEEINNKLILLMFKWDDILFEENDSSKRNQMESLVLYSLALDKGLMNRNEIRGRLGMGDIKDGDLYTISTSAGILPLDEEKRKEMMNEPDQRHNERTSGGQRRLHEPDDPDDKQKREDRRREPDARKR